MDDTELETLRREAIDLMIRARGQNTARALNEWSSGLDDEAIAFTLARVQSEMEPLMDPVVELASDEGIDDMPFYDGLASQAYRFLIAGDYTVNTSEGPARLRVAGESSAVIDPPTTTGQVAEAWEERAAAGQTWPEQRAVPTTAGQRIQRAQQLMHDALAELQAAHDLAEGEVGPGPARIDEPDEDHRTHDPGHHLPGPRQ